MDKAGDSTVANGVRGGGGGEEATAAADAAAASALESELTNDNLVRGWDRPLSSAKASQNARCVMKLSLL